MNRETRRTAAWSLALTAILVASGAMAQGNSSGTTPAASNGTAVAQPMPHGVVPNKAELAISAFHKLDPDNKGYVTRDDVAQLPDFESAFAQADQNHDGRLNASEFNSAWAIYTGNNP